MYFETNTAPAVGAGYGTAIDQIVARGHADSNQSVCQCYGSALTNSVVVALPGSSGPAAGLATNGGSASLTYRNDTFYASDAGAQALGVRQIASPTTATATINAVNVIARNSAVGGTDVIAAGDNTSITMSSSAYATTSGSVTDGGGNVASPPQFVDASGGDFREQPGSATIDAGVASSANGTSDFDGGPRTINGKTDIGAFEFAPAPAVTTSAATNVSNTTAKLHGTVNPNGRSTSYHFEYGPSTSYGHSTASQSAGSGTAAIPVSQATGGLLAGKTYHYRLVATSPAGTRTGADRSFTTPKPPTKSHFSGAFVARKSAKVKNGVARVKVACPKNAAAPPGGGAKSCTGTLTLKMAKKVKTGSGKKKRLKIGLAVFSIGAGKHKTLKVPVSTVTQALLATNGKLDARAIVMSQDTAGTRRKRTRTILLELPK